MISRPVETITTSELDGQVQYPAMAEPFFFHGFLLFNLKVDVLVSEPIGTFLFNERPLSAWRVLDRA